MVCWDRRGREREGNKGWEGRRERDGRGVGGDWISYVIIYSEHHLIFEFYSDIAIYSTHARTHVL